MASGSDVNLGVPGVTGKVGGATPALPVLTDISVMIGGQGGDGTLTVSDLLARYFRTRGLYVYTSRNVLSRIRGGHADASMRASVEENWARKGQEDVVVAFDEEAATIGRNHLASGGIILADQGQVKLSGDRIYHLPLSVTAASKVGNALYKNTVAYGALTVILGLDAAAARAVIETRFGRRGGEALQKNLSAFDLGRKLASEALPEAPIFRVQDGEARDLILTTGNQGCALGFLVGGGRFFAGYPITPATPIMEALQRYLPEFHGVVRQAEDELAAINMAIGAAYAGARAMTATSGPGLSLMTEGVGHAGEAEVPVVVVDCQRVGPSTGEPTRHEQSDLLHVVFSSHGEFPRFVISPGTASEAFELTAQALNLAEKWQLPVILLMDQALSENLETCPRFDLGQVRIDRGKLLSGEDLEKLSVYKRYEFTPDGVSPRTVPGLKGGESQTTGNEHDEWGHVSVNRENRKKMMAKRMKRLELARPDLPPPQVFGPERAPVGFVGYGSTYGPIREAQRILQRRGLSTRFYQARTLWPVPTESLSAFLDTVDKVYVVEHNYMGQLAMLIREYLPSPKLHRILKYDGDPFSAEEIVREVSPT
jgi:2-oxoglutarate ferredoxin oxidoreductase subunit alpha